MKKRTILIVVALLLIPIIAASFTPKLWMRYSVGNTADVSISAVEGFFYGIIVKTDGSFPVWVNVFADDVSTPGTNLIKDWVVTTSSTDRTQSTSYDPPLPYSDGLMVDVSTGGTVSFDVFYRNSDD